MTPHFARSLTASFGLHAAVLGVAALLFTLSPRVPLDPKPLEIVTLIPTPAPHALPAPLYTAPRPQPAPQPQTTLSTLRPTLAPLPPTSKKAAPAAPASHPAAPTTAGQRISHTDFIKQHGKGSATSTAQPRPTAPIPQLSSADILADLTTPTPGASAADPQLLAHLVAQLQAAFAATGPWPENLSATLSFTLGPDGRLHAIKVAASSQHPAFDAAAQQACRQPRLPSLPSGTPATSYQITFRSEVAPPPARALPCQ